MNNSHKTQHKTYQCEMNLYLAMLREKLPKECADYADKHFGTPAKSSSLVDINIALFYGYDFQVLEDVLHIKKKTQLIKLGPDLADVYHVDNSNFAWLQHANVRPGVLSTYLG